MFRRFFRVIAVWFTPIRASRRLYQYESQIRDFQNTQDRAETRYLNALSSRVAGTYQKAYAAGYRDAKNGAKP